MRQANSARELEAIGIEFGGLLPVPVATALLGVHRETMRRWIEAGRLRAVVWWGWRLVSFDDVEAAKCGKLVHTQAAERGLCVGHGTTRI